MPLDLNQLATMIAEIVHNELKKMEADLKSAKADIRIDFFKSMEEARQKTLEEATSKMNQLIEDAFDKHWKHELASMIPDPKDYTGPKGEKGEKGDTAEINYVELIDGVADKVFGSLKAYVEGMLPDLIPEPIKGDQGEKGDKGEDGETPEINYNEIAQKVFDYVDAHATEFRGPQGPTGEAGKQGEKGDTGGRGEKGEKGDVGPAGADGRDGLDGKDAPPPTAEAVKAAVLEIYPLIRKDLKDDLPRIEHKGPYREGETYYAGDEVMKDDSTWRALRETDGPPPSEDWQCVAKSKMGKKGLRGPEGERGDIGPKGHDGRDGKDGRGIDDVHISEDGELVFAFSDGDLKALDVTVFLGAILNKGDQ